MKEKLPARIRNEKLKRAYFHRLEKGPKGFSKASIQAVEKAIWKWEDFTKHADYAAFNEKLACGFKAWLAQRKSAHTDAALALGTQYHTLRHLREFFGWVAEYPGYKSKIDPQDVQFLSLSKKETRIAITPKMQEYPPLDYVIKLCQSIEVKTEVD
jgi:hypothetical protein